MLRGLRCLTDDNDNALFCSAGSTHQDRSAGGYQGHGRHGGKYSVAQLNYFLTSRGSQCYGTLFHFTIEELELRSRNRFLGNTKSFP